RFDCDWSSDVCSSDLTVLFQHYFCQARPDALDALRPWLPIESNRVHLENPSRDLRLRRLCLPTGELLILSNAGDTTDATLRISRSEERRVGKEWRRRP